jgi:hypothetical protein
VHSLWSLLVKVKINRGGRSLQEKRRLRSTLFLLKVVLILHSSLILLHHLQFLYSKVQYSFMWVFFFIYLFFLGAFSIQIFQYLELLFSCIFNANIHSLGLFLLVVFLGIFQFNIHFFGMLFLCILKSSIHKYFIFFYILDFSNLFLRLMLFCILNSNCITSICWLQESSCIGFTTLILLSINS